jgi:hypothetical protein
VVAPPEAPAARRLVLSADEYAMVLDVCGVVSPTGLGAPGGGDVPAGTVGRTLVDRGVLVESGNPPELRPVEPVAANLAVLTGSAVTIQVEVSTGERGLRAVFAVCGASGASLLSLAGGAVELSMFAATAIGVELIRAVPAPEDMGKVRSRVGAALGGDGGPPQLVGRVPLAALESGVDDPATAPAALVEEINRHTTGLLSCVVTGRVGDALAVGQVVWLATHSGWLGLRPDPDTGGVRMVAVEPVDRTALGVWVAPFVAEILAARR